MTKDEARKQGLCTQCRHEKITDPAYKMCEPCRVERQRAFDLNVAAGICTLCAKRVVTSPGLRGGLTLCDICLRKKKKAQDMGKWGKSGPKTWEPES
jgi:hypothetical protein